MLAVEQENNSNAVDIFVARQAILDCKLDVFGYELLFRDGDVDNARFLDGTQATSKLLDNAFIEIGLEKLANDKHAFINLTRDYITGKAPLPIGNQKIVLEILEDIDADPEIIDGLKVLKEQGFIIALDDFVLSEGSRDLLTYADIIKIDILNHDADELETLVSQVRNSSVKLLAEKVETQTQFEMCQALGFDLFQGYFFCQPTVISQQETPANQITLLNMLAKLQSDDCDLKEIENIISMDVGISYKLLKVLNSPFYGLNSKVNSIQHALVLLGLKALKSWISVISLSIVKGKPTELSRLSLIRAKMAEILAVTYECKSEEAFTVGLFSLLDALLDRSFDDLVGELPLSQEIITALLENEGNLGKLLVSIISFEKGTWTEVCVNTERLCDFNNAYWEAISWSDEITSRL